MKNSMLIFDSGVGGLSILQEVARLMPDITLDYLMDSEFFPYGIREDQELIQRIVTFCKAAVEQRQPSVLILACNTASTLALPALREILSIPVVGVVPAIRVAGERSLSLKDDGPATIGLLATPATVNRPYTQDLIEQFAPHCEVQCLGSRYLVELAEAYIGGDDVSDALFEHLNSWLMQHPKMQMIVLGCTHFPLLRVPLEVLWPNIQWLDSGQAVAAQAKRVYDINHPTSAHLNRQTHAPLHLFWTGSKEPLGVVQFLSKIGLVQTKQAFTF